MSSSSESRRVKLKLRHADDIRVVVVSESTVWEDLLHRLRKDYDFDVSLKYEDSDGDWITLSSEHDFRELLDTATETISVLVTEVLLPQLSRSRSASIARSTSGQGAALMSPIRASEPIEADLTGAGGETMGERLASPSHVATHSQLSVTSTSNVSSPVYSGAFQSSNFLMTPVNTGRRSEEGRLPNIDTDVSKEEKAALSSNSGKNGVRWKKAELLGQGAFGVVYLGLNIDTGSLMAVKQIAVEDVSRKELAMLQNEINTLKSLEHPNIVRYIDTEVTPQTLSIFLEYIPGGSIKTLIDKFGHLEESVAQSYTRQLLLGLEYLHRNGIAHRDMKGANCLVGNDGVIKLADFGASKQWRANNKSTGLQTGSSGGKGSPPSQSGEIKGTPSWMAPEVIRDQGSNIGWKRADVWSLACTTLEMITGKPPWHKYTNPVTVLYQIACTDSLPDYPENVSTDAAAFLDVCLDRNPNNRPDVTSLLLHPFVAHSSAMPVRQSSQDMHNWESAQGRAQRPSTVSTTPWASNTGLDGGRDALGGWDCFADSRKRNRGESARPTRAPMNGAGGDTNGASDKKSGREKASSPTTPAEKTDPEYTGVGAESNSPELTDKIDDKSGEEPLLPVGLQVHIDDDLEESIGDTSLTRSQDTIGMLQSSTETDSLSRGLGPDGIIYHSRSGSGDGSREADSKSDSQSQPDVNEDSMDAEDLGPAVLSNPFATFQNGMADSLAAFDAREHGDDNSLASQTSASVDTRNSGGSSSRNSSSHCRPQSVRSGMQGIELGLRGVSAHQLRAVPSPLNVSLSEQSTPRLRPLHRSLSLNESELKQTQPIVAMPAGYALDPLEPSRMHGQPSLVPSPMKPMRALSFDRSLGSNTLGTGHPPSITMAISDDQSLESSMEDSQRDDDSQVDPSALLRYLDRENVRYRSQSDIGVIHGHVAPLDVDVNTNTMNATNASMGLFPGESPSQRRQRLRLEKQSQQVGMVVEGNTMPVPASPMDHRGSWGSLASMASEDPPGRRVGFTNDKYSDENVFGPIVDSDADGEDMTDLGVGGISLGLSVDGNTRFVRSPVSMAPYGSGINSMNVESPKNLDLTRREIHTANRDRARDREARRDQARRGIVSALPRESSLQGQALSPPGHLLKRRANSGGPTRSTGLSITMPASLACIDISAANAVDVPQIVTSPVVSSGRGAFGRGDYLNSGHTGSDPQLLARLQRGPFGGYATRGGGGGGGGTSESSGYGHVVDAELDGREMLQTPSSPRFPSSSPDMLNEHEGAVTRMRCPGHSNLMLSASTDGTVRIWGNRSTESLAVLAVSDVTQSNKILSPPRNLSAKARLSSDSTSHLGHRSSALRPASHRRIKVLHCWADSACDTVWGACSDGAVRVWSGAEGRPLRLLQGHEEGVTCIEGMESSEFGRGSSAFVQGTHDMIATGSTDKTVRMWDYRAKKALVHTFRGHSDSILALRWGDGGRSILSGSKDKTLKIWDTRAGRVRVSLDKHFGAVTTIRNVPEGANIYGAHSDTAGASHISAGRDANLHFWTSSGKCVASLAAHRGGAACLSDVRITPQDSTYGGTAIILSSGIDGIVRLWDTRRRKQLAEMNCGDVTKMVWSGWGESFVTAYGNSGCVRLWEHKPLGPSTEHLPPSESLDSLESSGSLLGSLSGKREWDSKELVSADSHCTDIKSNDQCLAVSFKNGRILRWAHHDELY